MEKVKRGRNFTPQEKEAFLDIVGRYSKIVEDKSSNSSSLAKKQDTWKKISLQFNSTAAGETGERTVKQLYHYYCNTKRRVRKNVADDNKKKYIENTQGSDDVEEEDINIEEIKKKASKDRIELNKTGGGKYTQVLSCSEEQVLATIVDQVTPLENPYDDYAIYFGDEMEIIPSTPKENPIIIPQEPVQPPLSDCLVPAVPDTAPSTSSPKTIPMQRINKKIIKKKLIPSSKLKTLYYAKKLEVAKFELYSKKQQHVLDMKIKKTQLKKLNIQ